MLYALVYYTKLENQGVRDFRDKYDPWCKHVKDHLTLIFPAPASVGLGNLKEHINLVVKDWHPFEIHIANLEKSWDHFLLLTLSEGNTNVVKLHQQLYTGILEPYRRKDLKFIPHIGLGFFGSGDYDPLKPERVKLDEEVFNKAMLEAQHLAIDCFRTVDKLTLLELSEDLSGCRDIDEFTIPNSG
jgi:2'-5' RNA ligase